MKATEKLLDKYAEACYARTDSEIAARLKVKKQTVSGWRNGKAHPDADSVEKMAIAIGELPGPWLASIEADRARTPAARMVWLRLAQTFGITLTLALIITLPTHVAHATVTTSAAIAAQGRHLHQLKETHTPPLGGFFASTGSEASPARSSTATICRIA